MSMKISPKVLGGENKFKKEFSQAKPFPHLVIPEFLTEDSFRKVKRALVDESMVEKECDLFRFFQSENLTHAKEKSLREFLECISSREVLAFLSAITGKKLKGSLDVSAFRYEKTHYLLCHDDRLENRKIAFVFYASAVDGGELVFYDAAKGVPTKKGKEIAAAPNQLVLFEVSSRSFHEVREVLSGKRYSIGGWWY